MHGEDTDVLRVQDSVPETLQHSPAYQRAQPLAVVVRVGTPLGGSPSLGTPQLS